MHKDRCTIETRPNVILLMGEDTGLHLGCYGDCAASTPNLDRLAREGCRYTSAISTAPVCAPARSSVVTGMYPWSLGTHQMRSTLLHPPRLFTHELRDAGYYVNWPTKRDFNFDPTPGWCDDCNQDIAVPDWPDASRAGTLPHKPFFLYSNFYVTHESTMWSKPFGNDLGARHYRLQLDHLLKPGQRHEPATISVPAYLPDVSEVRQNLAWYYDALSIQDAQIGQVLDALAASPYADNTIVIYMTDHGRGLPREKRWCYDAGVHLPLIVRGPGIAPGTVDDAVVNWVDIAPTILSLAGADIPGHYQGQAFLGAAKATTPRQYAFAGRDRIDEAFDHVRVARDQRWHYIRNTWPCLPYAQRSWYMERMATMQVLRRMRAAGELGAPGSAPALWMSDTKLA
ncbi:MAG: sulfatase, partial [Phycisphaeraceae bacterium]